MAWFFLESIRHIWGVSKPDCICQQPCLNIAQNPIRENLRLQVPKMLQNLIFNQHTDVTLCSSTRRCYRPVFIVMLYLGRNGREIISEIKKNGIELKEIKALLQQLVLLHGGDVSDPETAKTGGSPF